MPRANNNSRYNSKSSNSSRRSSRGGDARASKFGKDKFNMLNFGYSWLDEVSDKKYEFKSRICLKAKDGELLDVYDKDGEGEEYTPEQSALLIAKALLEGRAINICYFPNDDGTWSGNARIDITGLEAGIDEEDEDDEEEEPAPRRKAATPVASKKKSTKKQTPKPAPVEYTVPDDADEDEETEDDEESDDFPPF